MKAAQCGKRYYWVSALHSSTSDTSSLFGSLSNRVGNQHHDSIDYYIYIYGAMPMRRPGKCTGIAWASPVHRFGIMAGTYFWISFKLSGYLSLVHTISATKQESFAPRYLSYRFWLSGAKDSCESYHLRMSPAAHIVDAKHVE